MSWPSSDEDSEALDSVERFAPRPLVLLVFLWPAVICAG